MAKQHKSTPESKSQKFNKPQKFNLWWGPEGRKIATVEAVTIGAAVRKAPKPYKAYPGEIYATLASNDTEVASIAIPEEATPEVRHPLAKMKLSEHQATNRPTLPRVEVNALVQTTLNLYDEVAAGIVRDYEKELIGLPTRERGYKLEAVEELRKRLGLGKR
jgi:hypothetical protein